MTSYQHPRASWLTVPLVVTLAIGCGTPASPSPAPTDRSSASPASSTSSSLATPVPSRVAEIPITPTSDEIIVQVDSSTSEADGLGRAAWLYADASLLSLEPGRQPRVWALTAGGLTEIVNRLEGSGLFAKSHTIPIGSPVNYGFTSFSVTLHAGDRAITVAAANAATDTASKSLVGLAEGLLDPSTWLPTTAFAEGKPVSHPYQPLAARVTAEVIPLAAHSWTNAAQTLNRVAWPLATPATELGQPVSLSGQPDRRLRCGQIAGADELAIRGALASFSSDVIGVDQRTTGWYLWLDGPALLRLTLRAFLPHEAPACSVADLGRPPKLADAPRPSLAALLAASEGGITPPSGEPELYVQSDDPDSSALADVRYYADGTVLFRDPPAPAVGIGVRRLSAAGIAELHRRLDASGLLDANYEEPVPGDASPFGVYRIFGASVNLYATDRGKVPRAIAVAALAANLIDPVAWLPAGSWLGDPAAVQQYRPGLVNVTISNGGWQPDTSLPSVAALRWPLTGSIETFGSVDEELPGMNARWADLSVADALALLRALEATGAECWGAVTGAECVLADSSGSGVMKFEFGAGENPRATG